MKITYFGYNNFVLETEDKKIVFDPGADLYLMRYASILPKSLWNEVTHIFITHTDPDHYWYVSEIAKISGAKVFCNKKLIDENSGLLPGKRKNRKQSTSGIGNLTTLSEGDTIHTDDFVIRGFKTRHGNLNLKIGPFRKTIKSEPHTNLGLGSMGYQIQFKKKSVVNFGDTVLLSEEWNSLKNSDLVMIPIGGAELGNTMSVAEALEAVRLIRPRYVIPCHYNCASFFKKKTNKADEVYFMKMVEINGSECRILKQGDTTFL